MFLKNRNISSKIKRSKVTDYAALNDFGKRNEMQGLLSPYPIGLIHSVHPAYAYLCLLLSLQRTLCKNVKTVVQTCLKDTYEIIIE